MWSLARLETPFLMMEDTNECWYAAHLRAEVPVHRTWGESGAKQIQEPEISFVARDKIWIRSNEENSAVKEKQQKLMMWRRGVEIVADHFISELFLFTTLLSFGILQSSSPRSKCLGSCYCFILLLLQGWIKYTWMTGELLQSVASGIVGHALKGGKE